VAAPLRAIAIATATNIWTVRFIAASLSLDDQPPAGRGEYGWEEPLVALQLTIFSRFSAWHD
jgi:hypothetical protein